MSESRVDAELYAAAARLRVAHAALADAQTAFLAEAATTTDPGRLDWLYTTAAELRQLADRVDNRLRVCVLRDFIEKTSGT